MIKRFLGRVFSGRLFRAAEPTVIPRSRHRIPREHISRCALRTVEALQEDGFQAYIVGGAVRDLALGLTPKDFDLATDATPEEVRGLFRRSRIIGRRFRLVHVLCGADMVEVSTFRGTGEGAGDGEEGAAAQRVTDEHGRLLRDNVFGDQRQDALRRDFAINALFYDPVREEIIDHVNGYADLQAKKLRLIGDPVTRYREDPVRMLRAVRFAASRGLEIEPRTRKPIRELADLLANVPASRLLDEMLKLLLSGHAAAAVARLRKEGLHQGLMPLLDAVLATEHGERFVNAALKNTDARLAAGKGVSPGFLFAALLWPQVLSGWRASEAAGLKAMPALAEAMDKAIETQVERMAIPRRLTADMREIWSLQPRFAQRAGQRPFRLLEHPRFRAAYDFLLLRCAAREQPAELGDWWTQFQEASDTERPAMLVADTAPRAGSGRRRRRRRAGGPASAAG
jgi:poly(A) polymerase